MMLGEGISEDVIAAALQDWDANPALGPGSLPYLVSSVVRARRIGVAEEAKMAKLRSWEDQLKEELSG